LETDGLFRHELFDKVCGVCELANLWFRIFESSFIGSIPSIWDRAKVCHARLAGGGKSLDVCDLYASMSSSRRETLLSRSWESAGDFVVDFFER